jgi:hypothetical protein
MIIEVGFSDMVFLALGFAIGVMVALVFFTRFRRPPYGGSKSEHAELGDLGTLTLRGLENVASIQFNRDRRGKTTSVTIRLEGESGTRVYPERRSDETPRFPEPPTNVRVESFEDVVPHSASKANHGRVESLERRRESVRGLKMRLTIETDRRTVEKEFSNLHDLKWFMDSFFSSIADRRFRRASSGYAGPERRKPAQ